METLRSRKAALILLFCVFVQSNAIMPKPGNCPRIVESFITLPPCNYDRDCPGDQKCCTFFFRSGCTPPVPTLPGCPVPPGAMAICLEQCTSDADCPGQDQICCFNGCGHVCKSQIPVKPGQCNPDDLFTHRCHSYCENDGDCRGELKCCPSFCGNVCKFPWFWPQLGRR
ncbi:perlwapin-like [Nothobranchius furzeri]|uniref:Whey acidic protein-like n=1 Tax=Nothobranchius furzeri TaxID=105023 RepID=A0A9D2XZ93_NOTFU|nr:whey acidic protein-like [Nothobranchius furzeri]